VSFGRERFWQKEVLAERDCTAEMKIWAKKSSRGDRDGFRNSLPLNCEFIAASFVIIMLCETQSRLEANPLRWRK
jgi:hypothetical protein